MFSFLYLGQPNYAAQKIDFFVRGFVQAWNTASRSVTCVCPLDFSHILVTCR